MYIIKTLEDAVEASNIKELTDEAEKSKREKALARKVIERTIRSLNGDNTNNDVFPGTEEEKQANIKELTDMLSSL